MFFWFLSVGKVVGKKVCSKVGFRKRSLFQVRTPFVQSGTVFKDLMAVDLQKEALKGMFSGIFT